MLARLLWNLGILLRNQWLSPERLRARQNRKLRRIVRHAYDNVPHYRRLFDEARLRPEDIRTVDELRRLPITTKEDLQQTPVSELLCRSVDPSRCHVAQTAGSTGIPLKVYLTQRELDIRLANDLRVLFACTGRIVPRIVRVSRHTFTVSWLLGLACSQIKHIHLSEGPQSIVELIHRFKPHVLWGNTTSLQLIARAAEEKGLAPIHIEAVFAHGEVLDPSAREEIGHIFTGQIFDLYGAWEFGRLGWECHRHAGIHLCTDTYVFEFIRDGRPARAGQTGEIVVTSLVARAMPLIRYRLADLCGILEEPCPCGRGLPLVKVVEGRRDDMYLLPDGRQISPLNVLIPLCRAVDSLTALKQYRIIQDRRDHITIEIVRRRRFPQDGVQRILSAYQSAYPCLKTDVRFLSNIGPDPSGKLRRIVSLVGGERQQYPLGLKVGTSTGKT